MSKKKDNPIYYQKGHELLDERKCGKIERIKELYAKDKYKARIIYMNDTSGYTHFRIMLFTEKNGDFSIVRFRRTYGVSKTNKMYSHEKRLHTVTYTKGKFWIINNESGKKYVTHLSLDTLYRVEGTHATVMKNYLSKRFSWINYMYEENILWKTSFNTIVKNKVYSFKKALQFQYKMPAPPASIIHKHTKGEYYTSTNLKYYMDYVDNVQSIRDEWFSDGNTRSIFHDTLKMGKTLNKKVNCSWSNRRLKEEHDKWSQEITDVIFIDGDRPLGVLPIYSEFALMGGYKMLTTTKELAIEGKRNNHCVATYVSKVENGGCAIYSVGQNTLEIVRGRVDKKDALKIGQIRGYKNKSVPEYIKEDILKQLIKFNKEVVGVVCSEEFYSNSKSQFIAPGRNQNIDDLFDELPF